MLRDRHACWLAGQPILPESGATYLEVTDKYTGAVATRVARQRHAGRIHQSGQPGLLHHIGSAGLVTHETAGQTVYPIGVGQETFRGQHDLIVHGAHGGQPPQDRTR